MLARIRCRLETFVNFLLLDQNDRIRYLGEQLVNANTQQLVPLVFEIVQSNRVLANRKQFFLG
ncbi:hypothetical protein D3C78_1904150 [compost metagenome]